MVLRDLGPIQEPEDPCDDENHDENRSENTQIQCG